jgi:hypothetical protein
MSTQAIDTTFSNIIPPDDATAKRLAVISRAQQLAESMQKIVVNSPESYVVAGETLRAVKSLRNELDQVCRPEIDTRFKAHKEAVKQFKEGDGPLEQVENFLKRALLAWDQEQERIRRAEQARLQREAQEKAEAEARRLAEEQKLQEAIAAEESGDKQAAKDILEAPVVTPAVWVPPVVLPAATPKVEGLSKRQVWKCEVNDLMALVKAVAAGQIPLAAIEANTVFLGQQARSLKGEMKYPGVRVWPEDSLAGRG